MSSRVAELIAAHQSSEEQARREERLQVISEHGRRASEVRRERSSLVTQIRRAEWQFELHPNRARALMLADMRGELSHLELELVELLDH